MATKQRTKWLRRSGNPSGSRPFGFRAEQLEPRQLFAVSPASAVSPSGDPRIDAVLGGSKWDTQTITYSFYDGGAYYGSESTPTPVSTAVRDNVRTILSNVISPLVNLTFTEVPDSATSFGTVRYLCSPSPGYAYAYYPGSSQSAGDVVLNTSWDIVSSNTNAFRNGIGSHGFQTLIHETCHALGLKHPGDYNGSGTGQPPYLPLGQDNWDNSLMSYNFYSGKEPASPMAYDVLALGYIYGAKTATRAGDTTYTFATTDAWSASDGTTAGLSTARSKNMLWDGGGTDTISLAGLPADASGYRIDINPGGWITPTTSYNTAKYNATTGSPTRFSAGTTYASTDFGTRLPLAGTTIENVIVSGSSDTILVNAAANRISGYAAGSATGADVISGADQADTLDLSSFLESAVVKTQVGNDLVLNLGGTTGTVTVKDYFAVGSGSRINIIYAAAPLPTFVIAATSADKAEGTVPGSTPFTFTVTRSGELTAASSVSWAVTGSGANPANAADFTNGLLPSGTISFAAGEATKTITVNVAADAAVEPDESFTVTLSSPSGAVLGSPALATGTIRNDDDYRSRISIAAADAVKAEGDIGRTPFTFTLTRTGNLGGDVSVPWSIAGSGTYKADRFDFIGGVLPSGVIRFAAGRQTATLTVNVPCDRIPEFDEQFTITLGNPLGGLDVLGGGASFATGTILNDDAGVPRPAAVGPAPGRAFAGLAADVSMTHPQSVTAKAFAALADGAGGSRTITVKRLGPPAAIRP